MWRRGTRLFWGRRIWGRRSARSWRSGRRSSRGGEAWALIGSATATETVAGGGEQRSRAAHLGHRAPSRVPAGCLAQGPENGPLTQSRGDAKPQKGGESKGLPLLFA